MAAAVHLRFLEARNVEAIAGIYRTERIWEAGEVIYLYLFDALEGEAFDWVKPDSPHYSFYRNLG